MDRLIDVKIHTAPPLCVTCHRLIDYIIIVHIR
ncbi:hypothetical protein BAMTA208_05025 [Bacillus amyloliquefaciens TA208]|nr:hypothetical protein BAMTA208_05025 [Bacillus amyloliquefaciens TA208]